MACELSIIIVSWNTRDLLRDCLASLTAATAGLSIEIIVVDNASRDGTPEMLARDFPQVKLILCKENLGFSRANNLALEKTTGDYHLLLNPDTICPPGSLKTLHAFLEGQTDAAAAGPTLVDAQGHPTASYGDFPALRHHLLSCLDPQRRWLPGRWRTAGLGRVPEPGSPSQVVDYVKGACLLIRGTALAKVGQLDELFFMYFEETDWCRRAHAAGYRIYHCADAAVVHLEGRAAEQVSDFSRAQFQHSYRQYLRKHRGRHWVPVFRAAQLLESGCKGLARILLPGPHNRRLAHHHFANARLIMRGDVEPQRPA